MSEPHDLGHRVSCETIDVGRYRAVCSCGWTSVQVGTKAIAFHVSASHLLRLCVGCHSSADALKFHEQKA